jgi:hypothetical protein
MRSHGVAKTVWEMAERVRRRCETSCQGRPVQWM